MKLYGINPGDISPGNGPVPGGQDTDPPRKAWFTPMRPGTHEGLPVRLKVLVSIIGAILFFSTLCIAGELQEEQQKNQ